MKTLLLLRHAKSSWSDPTQSDHDRPLNDRGKRDAPRMGQWIQQQGLAPDVVVSSTARRAVETARKVAEHCGFGSAIDTEPELYHAHSEQYGSVLRRIDDEHQTALLVAHNPGLEEFLYDLTGASERMPTAALAQISLDIQRWSDPIGRHAGRLIAVWRPKELP
jgi:phosphohistidine phosphatase